MKINPAHIKDFFINHELDWSSLYDELLIENKSNSPLYLGIYSLNKRRGFETAQMEFNNRLNKLINSIKTIKFQHEHSKKSIDKIENFIGLNKHLIDFNSAKFKEDCLSEILKPLHQIIKDLESKFANDQTILQQINSLKKYYYQLNPYNYSISYLTHLLSISDSEIKMVLVDNTKSKKIRNIDGILEFTRFITRLEKPKNRHKTELTFNYLMLELNPGNNRTNTTVFCGNSFSTNAGEGVREFWSLDSSNNWKHQETLKHWRR